MHPDNVSLANGPIHFETEAEICDLSNDPAASSTTCCTTPGVGLRPLEQDIKGLWEPDEIRGEMILSMSS